MRVAAELRRVREFSHSFRLEIFTSVMQIKIDLFYFACVAVPIQDPRVKCVLCIRPFVQSYGHAHVVDFNSQYIFRILFCLLGERDSVVCLFSVENF